MAEQTLVTYRDLILQLIPRWLRKGSIGAGIAGKILYAFGIQLDASADALVAGVTRRFPGLGGQYDSLPVLGAERRISRGPLETDAGYAARLIPWLDAHRGRGGPYAMLSQLFGYWLGAFPMALVYRSGAAFFADTSGNVTRGTVAGWQDTGPATWTLLFDWAPALSNDGLWGDPGLWGDGGLWGSSLTATQVQNLLLVPTEWNSADATGAVVLIPSANWSDMTTWQQPGLVSIPVR